MIKEHTRQLRRKRIHVNKDRGREIRPKTFKSEESAKKYAESKGIKDYKLIDLKETHPTEKKLRIEITK